MSFDLTDNEILSIRRFQHFSKKALSGNQPTAVGIVEPGLNDIQKKYLGQLDLKLSKKNYDTLFDSHKNIQRLCEEKRKNCCNSKGSFMWTTGSEDSYVTDDIVRHEAPISQVDIAGKGKVPKLVAASNSLSEDGATTTSAKEISSLLQSQKLVSSLELENERKIHSAAADRMLSLTGLLKEVTQNMSNSIVTQNKDLDLIHNHATENLEELDSQRKQLQERQQSMTSGFWMSLYAYVFILCMFLFTYLIIRLFPAYHPHR